MGPEPAFLLWVLVVRGGTGAPVPFTKVVLSSTNAYTHTVRASDLDGDGDLDVIFAAKNDQIVGWIDNADGIFEQFYETRLDRRGGLSSVACGDLDGDGTVDVVAAAQAGNGLYAYFNGGGSFTVRTISDAAKAPSALELADVDGDGDLDVVVASFGGELDWYENSNGFASPVPFHAVATGLALLKAVGVGDVDGDQYVDVLAFDPYRATPSWWRNPGTMGGSWVQNGASTIKGDVGYAHVMSDGGLYEDAWFPSSIKAYDFDGDGHLDIEFVMWRSGATLVYLNDGAQTFAENVVASNSNTRAAYSVAGDIDNDGDLDVVCAYEEGGTHQPFIGNYLEYHANGGEGTGNGMGWSRGNLMGDASVEGGTDVDAPNALEVADVDGDGDTDVLSTSGDDDMVALWRNDLRAATRKPSPAPGSGSSKDDDGVDGAATAGIAVGCVLGAVALVAAFAWYRHSVGAPSLGEPPPTCAQPARTQKQAPPKPPRRNRGSDAV